MFISLLFSVEALDTKSVIGPNFGYTIVGLSCCLFTINNLLILKLIAPHSVRQNYEQFWKWKNIANSFVHSLLSGTWALYNFWATVEVRYNLMSIYTPAVQSLIGFSVGYFIFDLVDMLANHRKRGTYELVLHHIIVITCFGLALVTRLYHGYTLLALMVEINSIFLHLRQLMIIQGFKRSSLWYRVNSSINLGTFVVFRLIPLSWMTRWLFMHRNELPPSHFSLGCFSNTAIFIMNAVLLLRILSKDCRSFKTLRVEPEEAKKTL